MGRPRKNVEEVEIEERAVPVVEETTPVEEVVEEKTGDVKVFDKTGNFIRAYSKSEHGKDFKKLAEGFAAKKGYSIR